MPLFTSEERAAVTERVAARLKDDGRIEGVLLFGSMVTGPDMWSDVDLEAAVDDDADLSAVIADAMATIYDELTVVHHFEVEFGDTRLRGFLLEDFLEVDLAFTPYSKVVVSGPSKVLFDRTGRLEDKAREPKPWSPAPPDHAAYAGFTWHDVLHAAVAVRRRRPWQALWYMERVRNRTLALASERRGHYADFFDYVDDLPGDITQPLEPTLVRTLDPERLFAAIAAATAGFLGELRHCDDALAARLSPLLDFVTLARDLPDPPARDP